MGLEDLIKKGLGIKEDVQSSTKGAEDRMVGLGIPPTYKGSDHDIEKAHMPLQGGTSRTYYSIHRLSDEDEVEECEIEFCIEDQFTERKSINDARGYEVVVGTLLESTECNTKIVAHRIGHMNGLDYQGEIFYNNEYEAWFFADEFETVTW